MLPNSRDCGSVDRWCGTLDLAHVPGVMATLNPSYGLFDWKVSSLAQPVAIAGPRDQLAEIEVAEAKETVMIPSWL